MVNEQDSKPTMVEKVKAKIDRAQKMFLIINVLMTLIFASNSVWNMVTSSWGAGVVQYVTIALLAAYAIAFVVLIVLFNKDRAHLNDNMKNYKFAIKVMKKVVNLMNLALALSVMVEAITIDSGIKQIFAVAIAALGIAYQTLKFIFFVFKFIRKKKKAKLKAEKKAAKRETMDAKKSAMLEKTEKLKGVLGLSDKKTGNDAPTPDAGSEVAISNSDELNE